MKCKSPRIEAIAFAVRSIIIDDCEIRVHNFNAWSVYVDLHAVSSRNTCGFGWNSVAVSHPFTVGAWPRRVKSIMGV